MALPGAALFLYVAKMAAVELKCASIHTLQFDRFEYTIWVLSVQFLLPPILIGTPYVLKLKV